MKGLGQVVIRPQFQAQDTVALLEVGGVCYNRQAGVAVGVIFNNIISYELLKEI